jgi:hypothetical protein
MGVPSRSTVTDDTEALSVALTCTLTEPDIWAPVDGDVTVTVGAVVSCSTGVGCEQPEARIKARRSAEDREKILSIQVNES